LPRDWSTSCGATPTEPAAAQHGTNPDRELVALLAYPRMVSQSLAAL
jgi:hypothetical protein